MNYQDFIRGGGRLNEDVELEGNFSASSEFASQNLEYKIKFGMVRNKPTVWWCKFVLNDHSQYSETNRKPRFKDILKLSNSNDFAQKLAKEIGGFYLDKNRRINVLFIELPEYSGIEQKEDALFSNLKRAVGSPKFGLNTTKVYEVDNFLVIVKKNTPNLGTLLGVELQDTEVSDEHGETDKDSTIESVLSTFIKKFEVTGQRTSVLRTR